jgi:4-amino-4-deoxy-L-arabinose transferase-like glycosyltransferase
MENAGSKMERIKDWFSNPYNLLLVLIAAFALCIRLFFYFKTNGQTLWWDEAEYMSTAKKWAFGVPYDLNPQRPPLFQALSALAFIIGLSENFIKLAFVLLPSLALVIVTYYLGKEMYNEKVGVIAAALMCCSWSILFWTARVQPDFFSVTFQVLSILFMWKSWKNENPRQGLYAGIFAAVGFYFKVSALLVPLAFLVFIFIRDRFKGAKHKNHWFFFIGFVAAMIPYCIWSQMTFGTLFAFKANYSIAFTEATPRPFGWYNLEFFYLLTEGLLFALFLVGLIYALRVFLYADVIVKERKESLNPDLFSIIVLIVVAAFYIFYIRGTEDRWVFLWLPFIFFFIGNALMLIWKFVARYQAFVATALVVLLILVAGYQQIQHASTLISQRAPTYMPIKLAGLWIKDHSQPGDKVLSVSLTQATYYTERNVTTYSILPQMKTDEEVNAFVKAHQPKFIMWSQFEQHPDWTPAWIDKRQGNGLTLAYAYPNDRTQAPLVAVFSVNLSKF